MLALSIDTVDQQELPDIPLHRPAELFGQNGLAIIEQRHVRRQVAAEVVGQSSLVQAFLDLAA